MSEWSSTVLTGRRIVVADEDAMMVAAIIKALRSDGHAVFHAYDMLSAMQLAFALEPCDLVISNTRVAGAPGIELIHQLRQRKPKLPIIYLANIGRTTPEIEAELPAGIPILREPFNLDELRATVSATLSAEGTEIRP